MWFVMALPSFALAVPPQRSWGGVTSRTPRHALRGEEDVASGRQPRVVVVLETGPAVPEGRRVWAARHAGDQDVEVHVPAGADVEHGAAVGQAAMDQGEQHLVALGLELEGDATALSPGDGELARRIELGDPTLHAVLCGEAGWPLAGRVGQLVVAPHQLEGRADLHLHLARRQPFAAQVAVREIR